MDNDRTGCSNIPLVIIDTFGNPIPDEPKIPAKMKIIYDSSGGENYLESNHVDFEGKIGIEIRGKSSQSYPKKQYRFEIWGKKNNDLNVSLLQLAADSDWILYGPYADKTLLRNFLAYDLSNRIGRYAVKARFVEVFLNEAGGRDPANTYVGVYLLTETVKVGKKRIDIQVLSPRHNSDTEVTGGYILKIDKIYEYEDFFITDFGTRLIIVSPNRDRITEKQRKWIESYINEFEHVLNSENFKTPAQGYIQYIDVSSFIDFFILNELFKNVDSYRLSTFIHKDRDGPLNMGPIWDFNIAMGNVNYLHGWKTCGWVLDNFVPFGEDPAPFWWYRLFEDKSFVQKLIERWKLLRKNELAISKIMVMIDETTELLVDAQRKNFQKWPIFGLYVWPNPKPYTMTYEEEISRLKDWFKERIHWIDCNIETLLPK